jgi:hypothetical protein
MPTPNLDVGISLLHSTANRPMLPAIVVVIIMPVMTVVSNYNHNLRISLKRRIDAGKHK